MAGWKSLEAEIVACERCPRLIRHCRRIAREKRRAYRDDVYWGRPLPGFGDRAARILFLGLAPAAHGANRTGRMFTGDRSGEWLYGALHRAGLSDRAESVGPKDGLELKGAFITNTCRCAPPANRPSAAEIARCADYFDREIELLKRLRVVVALGKVAWDGALRRAAIVAPGEVVRPRPAFGHGAETTLRLHPRRPASFMVGSYHPSQQNTFTGRLTRPMFDEAIERAIRLADQER